MYLISISNTQYTGDIAGWKKIRIILTCVAKHNGQNVAVMFVTKRHIPIFPNTKLVHPEEITRL